MSPYQEAIKVYLKEYSTRFFREDLEAHLQNPEAYVFSTPEVFCMGRPVRIAPDSIDMVLDPHVRFTREEANCWHVYLYAGKANLAFTLVPYPLEYVSFERNNNLRVYKYEVIRSRINEKESISNP
jgi:hypothetical protein